MLTSVNVIIHAAWRVDFNLTLSSFAPNIEATQNLINFALDSKNSKATRFVFVSSITSVQSWTGKAGIVPESTIDNWKVAVGRGYGEGKYVAERVCKMTAIRGVCSPCVNSCLVEAVFGGQAFALASYVVVQMWARGRLPSGSQSSSSLVSRSMHCPHSLG